MVLGPRSSSAYNEMLGRRIASSSQVAKRSTLSLQRPAKRLKPSEVDEDSEREDQEIGASPPSPRHKPREVADSDAESGDESLGEDDEPSTQRTDLEQALPPIKTDKQAVEDYEAMRSAEAAAAPGIHERLNARAWVKGKSSIYVDAFNLALDTVLEEESHLFDEAEMKVFEDWRALSYEAQYLYALPAWKRVVSMLMLMQWLGMSGCS